MLLSDTNINDLDFVVGDVKYKGDSGECRHLYSNGIYFGIVVSGKTYKIEKTHRCRVVLNINQIDFEKIREIYLKIQMDTGISVKEPVWEYNEKFYFSCKVKSTQSGEYYTKVYNTLEEEYENWPTGCRGKFLIYIDGIYSGNFGRSLTCNLNELLVEDEISVGSKILDLLKL